MLEEDARSFLNEPESEEEQARRYLLEEEDTRPEFIKGVSSGIDTTQALGGGVAAMAGDMLGIESLQEWGLDTYQENMAEAQRTGPRIGRIEDIHSVGDFGDWAMGAVGQLAPTVATMIATGGIGSVVAKQAAKKSISNYLKRNAGKDISQRAAAKLLSRASAKGQIGGAAAGSIGLETGEIYGDVAAEGFEGARAIALSLAGGTMAGSLDILPVMRVAKQFGLAGGLEKSLKAKYAEMGIGKRIGTMAASQAGFESATEALQTVIEEGTKSFITGHDLPEDMASMVMNAAAAGGIGGLAMGGLGGVPRPQAPKDPKEISDKVQSASTVEEALESAQFLIDEVDVSQPAPVDIGVDMLQVGGGLIEDVAPIDRGEARYKAEDRAKRVPSLREQYEEIQSAEKESDFAQATAEGEQIDKDTLALAKGRERIVSLREARELRDTEKLAEQEDAKERQPEVKGQMAEKLSATLGLKQTEAEVVKAPIVDKKIELADKYQTEVKEDGKLVADELVTLPKKDAIEPAAEERSKPAEEEKLERYPVADRGEWYGDADYKERGGKIVQMKPDDYIDQVRPLDIDEESRENIDLLKQHMLEGKTLDPLAIYEDGSEDGRHRAIAAKELDIPSVPVIKFKPSQKETKPAEKIAIKQTVVDSNPSQELSRKSILGMTKAAYLNKKLRAEKIKKDSPGYAEARARATEEYEVDLDKAEAALPFEEFNKRNSESPETVNRQAYDALREEFGISGEVTSVAEEKPAIAEEKPKQRKKHLAAITVEYLFNDEKQAGRASSKAVGDHVIELKSRIGELNKLISCLKG